ncbi:MAG: metallophosphoesterase family protein [Polyangiaceae bacterium]
MLRRVGLIGDIHCEVARLKQVLELFRCSEVETVLAVGDIADGPGDLTEACALLEKAGALVVAGNHDRWLLAGEMRDLPDATPAQAVTDQARRYLSALPKTRTFDSPRGKVLLCHGLGEDDMACVRPSDEGYALHSNSALSDLLESGCARFVVNGHSHRPMLRTIDGLTIMNAGTLHPKHRPVCSIADFEAGSVQVFDVFPTHLASAERWSFERGSRPTQTLTEP